MNKYFYIIAIIIFIAWAVGFFAYHLGIMIHALLAVASMPLLLRFTEQNKTGNKYHFNFKKK
jgi:membrane protein implicated in regulation of membrane protease activity